MPSQKVASSTISKAAFKASLEAAGIKQATLARLLGVDKMTVNRWCNERDGALEVPQYAIAFVAAWRLLTIEARGRLLSALRCVATGTCG